jgi:phosphoglycolate phosphatase-like HAD superfamily hydrolase
LGDTVDDARSAQAARVPFVGVSTPHNPRHAEIAAILKQHAALAVIDDINQLEPLVESVISIVSEPRPLRSGF